MVGNSGTALYGRMDPDELATPGYAVLSPATRTKLATLEKGQLMIRHPHFTQPIFVRFPRPSVMQGREGADKYPQATEISLDAAVLRALRPLDPSITLPWVQDLVALYTEDEIIKARNATLLARPADVKAYFAGQFKKIIPAQAAPRPLAASIKSAPENDPYGF